MTRSELIKNLNTKYDGLYLDDITTVVDTVLDTISDELKNGNRVELRGFGSFSIRERAPRKARNPKTGDSVTLGKRNVVYFRAGKELRDRLND